MYMQPMAGKRGIGPARKATCDLIGFWGHATRRDLTTMTGTCFLIQKLIVRRAILCGRRSDGLHFSLELWTDLYRNSTSSQSSSFAGCARVGRELERERGKRRGHLRGSLAQQIRLVKWREASKPPAGAVEVLDHSYIAAAGAMASFLIPGIQELRLLVW